MPGPQVSHGWALAERRRAGHARPLPGARGGVNLPGTHICVPYKPSGNVRVVYRCGNTVGAGHARPAGVPQAGACGKVQGRACPAPTGGPRRRGLPGTHICVPYKLSGNVRVVYRCGNTVGAGHARPAGVPQAGACGKAQGRACPAPTAMQILPFFVPPPDDLGF